MASTAFGSEAALPHGAVQLHQAEVEAVAGGGAYYEICYWVGQMIGNMEYWQGFWLAESNDAAALIS